jgi:hypothetical protein
MEFLGLPLHPLVVHAAVILVPLAALGALLVVPFATVRTRYGWLTVAVSVAAAASAVAARFSGPVFAEDLGLAESDRIARHATYGTWMPWPVLVLVIGLSVFMVATGRPDRPGAGPLRIVGAVVTIIAAIASLVLIGLTGHAGATAVWGP